MKYLSLLLLGCFLTSTLSAQDVGKLYKSAKKALEKYQQGESEKLEEAFQKVEQMVPLLQIMEPTKAAKYQLKAGEVYNEIALEDYKQFLIYNDHQPQHPMAALKAADALIATVNNPDKKWDKKKALDELIKTITFITNEGIAAYNIEKYGSAYNSFQRVNDIRAILQKNDINTSSTEPSEYQQNIYRTALAAKRVGKSEVAIDLFEQLKELKYNNPLVYTSLHELHTGAGRKMDALNILQDGRELFPNSRALQIAEINWFMAEGELPSLIQKLKAALETDSENLSFYITLGHIYDQLQHQSAQQGDFQAAQDNFNEAKFYFTRVLDIDDQHAPALYNLGALFYNKAAVITQELAVLEGEVKVDNVRNIIARQAEMAALLDKALPFFQKAEAVDPNDLSTLTALKEIYARKDDAKLADEFAQRLAKVAAGEELGESYF